MGDKQRVVGLKESIESGFSVGFKRKKKESIPFEASLSELVQLFLLRELKEQFGMMPSTYVRVKCTETLTEMGHSYLFSFTSADLIQIAA